MGRVCCWIGCQDQRKAGVRANTEGLGVLKSRMTGSRIISILERQECVCVCSTHKIGVFLCVNQGGNEPVSNWT